MNQCKYDAQVQLSNPAKRQSILIQMNRFKIEPSQFELKLDTHATFPLEFDCIRCSLRPPLTMIDTDVVSYDSCDWMK